MPDVACCFPADEDQKEQLQRTRADAIRRFLTASRSTPGSILALWLILACFVRSLVMIRVSDITAVEFSEGNSPDMVPQTSLSLSWL